MENTKYFVYVYNLKEDDNRHTLRTVFSQFGTITKLYLKVDEPRYASIYYSCQQEVHTAVSELDNSPFGWVVKLGGNTAQNKINHINSSINKAPSEGSDTASNMSAIEEYEDLQESFDYVDVYGRSLKVLKTNTGEIFVPLREIRKTGFAIFHKENYDAVLVNTNQIRKEFELYLLAEAKNYMIKNKVTCVDEGQILNTIKRCENILLANDTKTSSIPSNELITNRRSISTTNKNNILVTSISELTNAGLKSHGPQQNYQQPSRITNNGIPTKVNRYDNVKLLKEPQNKPINSSPRETCNVSNTNTPPRALNRSNVNNLTSPTTHNRTNINNSTSPTNKPIVKLMEVEIIPIVKIQIGVQQVLISVQETKNTFWVQLDANKDIIEDLVLKVNDVADNSKEIEPIIGKFYIAMFEDIWYRVKVLKTSPKIFVHFIDYGNKSDVDAVRTLPENLKKIPAQAVQITIDNLISGQTIVDNSCVTIKFKKQNEDGTYLVSIPQENGTVETTSKKPAAVVPSPEKTVVAAEMTYLNVPEPFTTLKNDDRVLIEDIQDELFLVRTRECYVKCKELTEYIQKLDKSALVLSNVKVGQMVLSSKDGLSSLFRARVVKKEGSIVCIKYLDYSGDETLSIKSLRNVDEFLAKQPITLLVSPVFKGLQSIDKKAENYLQQLISTKEKLTVILDGSSFDLKCSDGHRLSEVIFEPTQKAAPVVTPVPVVASPVPVVATSSPVVEKAMVEKSETKTFNDNKVRYEDMDFLNVEMGVDCYMCYAFKDLGEITLICMREKETEWLTELTAIDVTDTTPYKPELCEMCLALYKGEEDESAAWYRGVVVDGFEEKDEFNVLFVDYGNTESLSSKDLRKFPFDLKKIPILGITSEFVGLPKTDAVLNRMKEMVKDGETADVDIKSVKDFKYQIEMPAQYKILKSEGLI